MGRAEDLFERLERFGVSAVDEMILDRQAEEFFLDFKRANEVDKVLEQHDRRNLAKALSGFANSEGGVILWGINASQATQDVAAVKLPLTDPEAFVAKVEAAVSALTVPPVQGTRSISLHPEDSGQGFVATLIPKSRFAPHQITADSKYMIRAGSSFWPAPHGVIAGLFGRPQPSSVFMNFEAKAPAFGNGSYDSHILRFDLSVLLGNKGPGSAATSFCSAITENLPGPNVQIRYSSPHGTNSANWLQHSSIQHAFSVSAHTGTSLPPMALQSVLRVIVELAPPFNEELVLSFFAGSSDSIPENISLRRTAGELESIYKGAQLTGGTLQMSFVDRFLQSIAKYPEKAT